MLTARQVRAFQTTVYRYYREHGRHDLPWRKTRDPYKILVSEIMLQQTQVPRVVPKYRAFVKAFPTAQVLAAAPLRNVLSLWSGLGYNRRAKYLQEAARHATATYGGRFPRDYKSLQEFPGIGPYTASAVCAFAFGIPVPCIETNIRTVYLHHFFRNASGKVSDAVLMEYVRATLDTEDPRSWYAALMDYGAHLKSSGVRAHRQSASYYTQSPFRGSRRALRGAVLKMLISAPQSEEVIVQTHGAGVLPVLEALVRENLIIRKGKRYRVR